MHTAILVEVAIREDQQEAFADGRRLTALRAVERGRLERLELILWSRSCTLRPAGWRNGRRLPGMRGRYGFIVRIL